MNIVNVQTFISIAHHQSFTKAAERCCCTQATASLRIKNLEDYYGVKLFDRIGKNIQLTDSGKILLPYMEIILSTFMESKDRIDQLKNLTFGEISIVSSHTPGTHILPEVICKFCKKHPKIKINAHIQYSKQVIRSLLFDFQYDLGFVSQPKPIEDDKLICQPILKDHLSVFTHPTHPWATRATVNFKELTNETLVLSNKSTTIIDYLNSLGNEKLNFSKQIVIGNFEAVKQAVMMGIGFSILSKFVVKDELASGKLKEIKIENFKLNRIIYLLRRKRKILSPASKAFISLLLDEKKTNKFDASM